MGDNNLRQHFIKFCIRYWFANTRLCGDNWQKCFSSCHERGTKKNSESPRGIEPQTFGFRAPILYHWATDSTVSEVYYEIRMTHVLHTASISYVCLELCLSFINSKVLPNTQIYQTCCFRPARKKPTAFKSKLKPAEGSLLWL